MSPAVELMRVKLTSLADQGFSCAEAADNIGANYHFVARYARKFSIHFRKLKRGRKPNAAIDPRAEDMRARYAEGQTLEEIGAHYGVSRERIRQILSKEFGVRGADGGQAARARRIKIERGNKRDARAIKAWGCNYREYLRIRNHAGRPTFVFHGQRRNAHRRGIVWDLSLWQWWKFWEQSGHWEERGRGHGYCMCRLNDTGSYAIDNIYIATNAENIQDYWVNRRAIEAPAEAA